MQSRRPKHYGGCSSEISHLYDSHADFLLQDYRDVAPPYVFVAIGLAVVVISRTVWCYCV